MKTAIVTFSRQGARVAKTLASSLADCRVYPHADAPALKGARRFGRVAELAPRLFAECRGLVFVAPTGMVVRAIAPCLKHKTADPAVVVVDVGARWAVSLLSGHEGGANELALAVANILDAEPVITTTTEAAKDLIVGVGCRRGAACEAIVEAVSGALERARVSVERVRLLASADIKRDEAGLIEAARKLALPLRLVSSAEIRRCARPFSRSAFVESKVKLPAVAEPAALLAGRRTQLLLPKQVIRSVTVAITREDCWSLA